MKMIFRWYPEANAIDLGYIRQIPGVTGIAGEISAGVGQVWDLEDILRLKNQVEKYGLVLEVIESVKIRKGASTDSESLGTVFGGEILDVIMKQADGWTKIKYKGEIAYVKSEYVE